MPTFDANVVVHIDESLSSSEIQLVEKRVSDINGIVSACVHERTPHLMVVDYDPNTLDSGSLLRQLQAGGLHAELIGGI